MCVCWCAYAGGCRKSVHKMADAHDISSSFHVGHARPMRPRPGTGGDFVVVCFECRLVARECCYLKLLVASLRFGFDGVRSPYICCSLCFVVVVSLKFSLFLFCSLSSSFSFCLQVAPSLATWPSLVSLSAASLNCFHPPIPQSLLLLIVIHFPFIFFQVLNKIMFDLIFS